MPNDVKKQPVRVLGIDPGTVVTGWGVVEERGNRLVHIDSGIIRVRGDLPQRLARIAQRIQEVVTSEQPTQLSIEKNFVGANVQSAFRLGEARGVILAAAGLAEIPVAEYSPTAVKMAVAGYGRATKEQVQLMVQRLLALTETMPADQSDALGIAICHIHAYRFAPATAAAPPARTRRTRRVPR